MSDYGKNKEGYFRRARKSYSATFNSSKDRLHRMIVEAKSRAKKKQIDFDINDEDIKWNDVCPVLGIPITFQRSKGKGGDDNSPSLDRIDNNLGYVKGNVRLISNRANKLKNDMSYEEMVKIYKNWKAI